MTINVFNFVINGLKARKHKTGNVAKMYAVKQICKHPELSDEKVKSITSMMK